MEVLPEEAMEFALEKFGASVPEVSKVAPKESTSPSKAGTTKESNETPGLFARLWNKYDADGKLMHKDNGDWGSWKGELDSDGKRTGKGTMKYDAGAVYEGDFVNDKYEGYGKYTWEDSDVYEGEWKDGERNGKGTFRSGEGIVEYSMYDNGKPVGEGVSWDPDRKKAFRLKDGDRTVELLIEEAEKLGKDMFDLPIPPYYKPTKQPSSGGFFSYFTSSKKVSSTQPTTSPDSSTVENWLKSELPNLNDSDLSTYSKQLLEDGFDSVEMLNHLEAGDLGFMKKAHQRVLVEKLKSKK